MGKIVAALHRMGFDEVFDTSYTADLTIMEESAEFLERVGKGEKLPLLTSCCPAWVKFVENEYPEFKDNISTCRSPQGMFSAVLKEYYRDEKHAQGKKTMVVSIMPCTAKKMEAKREDYRTYGEQDTDAVLTTTELIRMIDAHGAASAVRRRGRPLSGCHCRLWCPGRGGHPGVYRSLQGNGGQNVCGLRSGKRPEGAGCRQIRRKELPLH